MTEKKDEPTSRMLYRPELKATAEGLLFPGDLVGEWVDQLRDVCDDIEGSLYDSTCFHDLVALTFKLKRTQPHFIEQESGADVIESGEEFLKLYPDWIEIAWNSLDFSAWEKEVRALDEIDDTDLGDPFERVDWAVDLFEELDDAELIWSAGQSLSSVNPDLWMNRRHELDRSIRFLIELNDPFLKAGVFLQTAALTIRPELNWRNLNDSLAQTTRKFEHLLNELHDLQEEHKWSSLSFILDPDSETSHPVIKSDQQPIANWLPPYRTSSSVAAAESSEPFHIQRLTWHSPRGLFEASLSFPKFLKSETEVVLEFYPQKRASLETLGTPPVPILLGGLRGDLLYEDGQEGQARFTYEQLFSVQQFLDFLMVRQTEWKALFDLSDSDQFPPLPEPDSSSGDS